MSSTRHHPEATREPPPRCRQSVLLALLLTAAAGPLDAQRATPPVYTVIGRGPATYVLLSGMVGGVAGFDRVRSRLVARGHQVVVIDPYHLSIDSVDVSFAALARRVDHLLAQLGVTSAHLVGHSHGGAVAMRLAARSPGRVRSLHLLDVGAKRDSRGVVLGATMRLVPVVTRLPGGRSVVRQRFVRGLRQNSGNAGWLDQATQRAYVDPLLDDIDRVIAMALRVSRSREPESLDAVMVRIQVPVIVLVGAIPHASGPEPEELDALAPLGPRLRVERLPGVAHFPHEEAPDAVVRLLTQEPPLHLVQQDGGVQ